MSGEKPSGIGEDFDKWSQKEFSPPKGAGTEEEFSGEEEKAEVEEEKADDMAA